MAGLTRKAMGVAVMALSLVVMMACSEEAQKQSSQTQAGEGDNGGFLDQPHWNDYLARSDDSPFQPERSDWERVEALEQSERLDEPGMCGEPEQAVRSWAESRYLLGPAQDQALEVSIRTRVLRGGGTEGLLQRWGFKDDAVAGVDHRLRLIEEDGCWVVERVVARHYCRRGVKEGALCR